jgi:hypothetical protein
MRSALLAIFLLLTFLSHAQRDRKRQDHVIRDSAELAAFSARYNPTRALLYAAVIPGSGQVYTKKYWKLPLVYGGIGVTAYAIDLYQDGYLKYRGELFYNLNNGLESDGSLNPNTGFTTSQLRTIVDRYRRERDFMIIIMVGVYILQMIDAHVDTHLKEFDVNPNLHVRFEPAFSNDMLTGRMGGVSLKIRF